MSVGVATEAWLKDKGDGPKNDIPVPVPCCTKSVREHVEAIQVTERNRIAIITWLNSRQRKVRASIARAGVMLVAWEERKPRIAHVGDWVVHSRTGDVYIVQHQMFRTLFMVAELPAPDKGRKT